MGGTTTLVDWKIGTESQKVNSVQVDVEPWVEDVKIGMIRKTERG
jgi:hypothetical protein